MSIMLYPCSIQLGIELRTELYFVILLYQLGRVVTRIVLPKYMQGTKHDIVYHHCRDIFFLSHKNVVI